MAKERSVPSGGGMLGRAMGPLRSPLKLGKGAKLVVGGHSVRSDFTRHTSPDRESSREKARKKGRAARASRKKNRGR